MKKMIAGLLSLIIITVYFLFPQVVKGRDLIIPIFHRSLGILPTFPNTFLPIPAISLTPTPSPIIINEKLSLWKYQCIDTMKSSRDKARAWVVRADLTDVINGEMDQIVNLGANCVSIDTPYDGEFINNLGKWVDSARSHNLTIWFRGNFSGWEGWFGYPKFESPSEHHVKIYDFIAKNTGLFADGDLFTPVPEPENGIIGDPRWVGDYKNNYIQFLKESFDNCQIAVSAINKKVNCGYFSTNGDIAQDILDKETVGKIGNAVVVDHYVANSLQMGTDIKKLFEKYGVKIMIGEFGAPIPDINGEMNEKEQADFIRKILWQLFLNKGSLEGVNYWVLNGGTTALINDDGSSRLAAESIKDFYRPGRLKGSLTDSFGKPLTGIKIMLENEIYIYTDTKGEFDTIFPAGTYNLEIADDNYKPITNKILLKREEVLNENLILEPISNNLFDKFKLDWRNRFRIPGSWR